LKLFTWVKGEETKTNKQTNKKPQQKTYDSFLQ
jgi:hypothetical protein